MTSPYLYAARRPLALLVLLVALAAGLAVALWLLPVGLAAYAAMVTLAARDPALQAASQRAPRRRLTSPAFRAQIEALERSQQEIQRSVSAASGPISRLLIPIGDQTQALVDEAYMLCDKGQIIEAYLARTNMQDLLQRIAGIDRQIAATSDPYTLQQLQETRNALADKQRNAGDLNTYIGRIQAQLQNIAASLDNVLAETVRLRTADALSANSMTNQVAQRLSDLKSDMDTFQRVLDTALAGTTP
jgi:type IV secretory pathway TrbD component